MEENNNLENTENLDTSEPVQEHPKINSGNIHNAAGNGYQANSNAMKNAGKGINGVGKGLSGLGNVANAIPYVGPVLSGGFKALGGVTSALGKGIETAGKASKKTGKDTNSSEATGNDTEKKVSDVKDTSDSDSKNKKFMIMFTILSSSGCFSFFFIFFILFVGVLILLGLIEGSSINSSASSSCLPSITSICDSMTVDGVTMDIDEYVAGVVNAEVGGMTDANYNTYKAASVAARSYALVRSNKNSNGNCSIPNSTSFQAYKANPSSEIVNAVKETSGVVLVKDGSVYGSEYDALCIESRDDTYYYLCQGGTTEKNLKVTASWLESVRSTSYIEITSQQTHGRGMSQNGAWYLALEKGFGYQDILNYFYGDEGATLASINGSSCGTTSFTDLETYNLRHEGLTVLNRKLNQNEIDSLNNYINSQIEMAGDGTNFGVAAAGQSLVHGLEQMGYYLQYYWGGGHGGYGDKNGTFVGVNPNWGSTNFGKSDTGDGPYLGMDCSGFVSWAIRNGCNNTANNTASGWMGISKTHRNLKKAKPGDIIVSSSHVKLVIKNNNDGSVIVAEESDSLVFNRNSSLGANEYVGDMSSYYQSKCKASG